MRRDSGLMKRGAALLLTLFVLFTALCAAAESNTEKGEAFMFENEIPGEYLTKVPDGGKAGGADAQLLRRHGTRFRAADDADPALAEGEQQDAAVFRFRVGNRTVSKLSDIEIPYSLPVGCEKDSAVGSDLSPGLVQGAAL